MFLRLPPIVMAIVLAQKFCQLTDTGIIVEPYRIDIHAERLLYLATQSQASKRIQAKLRKTKIHIHLASPYPQGTFQNLAQNLLIFSLQVLSNRQKR